MSKDNATIGSVLRFLASGGMADEDPDVVRELLTNAHGLAKAVLDDPGASPALRAKATAFLDELRSDAFEKFG
ncbi:MAG: hypothetical protein JOY80_06135, partial [Candidatus Dormibacteraeota bacterium]|nr:hypothetical protein [Candidatus Dormibacteraeota bacterium]